nr:MAG: replicase protein [Drosophila Crammond virga-like virus]
MEHSNSQGLCYLHLFGFLSPQELKLVRAQLGIYPVMRRVVRVWYKHVHRREPLYVTLPTVSDHGLMHFEKECVVSATNRRLGEVYLTASEFFAMYVNCALRVGGDDGYCYSIWLSEAGFSPLQLEYAKVTLGRYPYVTDVMSLILNQADPMSTYLTVPTPMSGRLLHLQHGDRKLMFDIMWSPDYKNCRVGGEVHPASGMVDAISTTMALKNAGIDMEDVSRAALMREMSMPNSALRSALVDEKLAQARSMVNNTNERLMINYRLTDTQRVDLVSAYPNFSLQFSSHPNVHPHGLSAAARVCETQEALTMLNYSSTGVQQGSAVLVKDVGGNPVAHLQRRRMNVHCCCPILDLRDGQRSTTRAIAIQDMLAKEKNNSRKTKLVAAISDDFTRRMLWCERKGQDCAVRARACMFIHSTYDMTLADIANTLVSARSDSAVITLFYTPEVFVEKRGILSHQQCSWELTDRGTIMFSFMNDSSWTYEHKTETYLGLFSTNVILASNGIVFATEIVKIKLDVAFIKVTRIHSTVKCATKLRRVLYFQDQEPRIVLRSFTQCPPNQFHRRWHFKRLRVIVTRYFYNQVKAYALSLTSTRFNLHQVYDYARSVNGTVVINGVSVTQKDCLQVDDLNNAVAAIFVICFQERWATSQTTKELTELMVANRDRNSSWWELVVGKCKENVSKFLYGAECDDVHCKHTTTFLSSLWSWLMSSRNNMEVTAVKWGEPIAVETYVPPVEMWYTSPDSYLTTMLKQYEMSEVMDSKIVEDTVGEIVSTKFPPQDQLSGGAAVDRPECSFDVHTCVNRCVYSDDSCFHDLQEINVPGDGACMYHALLLVMRSKLTVSQLKQQLLKSRYLDGLCQRAEATTALTSDQWGNDGVLALVCFEFDASVCVHMGNGDEPSSYTVLSVTKNRNGRPVFHLRLRNSHYSALVPLNVTERRPIEKLAVSFIEQMIPSALQPALLTVVAGQDLTTVLENAAIACVGDLDVLAGSRDCLVEISDGKCSVISGSEWYLAWKLLDVSIYSEVTNATDKYWDESYDLTRLDLCTSRAAYKIMEICATNGISLRERDVLELGGAPGAFALLTAKSTQRYHCVTRPEFRCYSTLAAVKQFTVQYTTLEDFSSRTDSLAYDFVVGDAGTNTSYKWVESDALFTLQLRLVLSKLRDGGNAVVKHANLYSCMHHWNEYVDIVAGKFSDVSVVKPYSAHCLSTEVYVVLKNFSKGKSVSTNFDNHTHLGALVSAFQVFQRNALPAKSTLKSKLDRYKRYLSAITGFTTMALTHESIRPFENPEGLDWSIIIDMDYNPVEQPPHPNRFIDSVQPGWVMVRSDQPDIHQPDEETVNVKSADEIEQKEQNNDKALDDSEEDLRSEGMDRISFDCAEILRDLDEMSVLSSVPTSVEDWNVIPDDDDPSHHCSFHDQIMLDAERDYVHVEVQIHRMACKYFVQRPDLMYYQGMLGYFSVAMTMYGTEVLVHHCVDRMFAGELRMLLTADLQLSKPSSLEMKAILNAKTKLSSADYDMWFSLWQKVVYAGASHFVTDFGKPELEKIVTFVFLHGPRAFIPIMRAIYSHDPNPLYWCVAGSYYEWCKSMVASTRWDLYCTFLKRKVLNTQPKYVSPSLPEQLVKKTGQLTRVFADFLMKKAEPLNPASDDPFPYATKVKGKVVSEVSIGGVMLQRLTQTTSKSAKPPLGDAIDIELNRRANLPFQDVKSGKAMQHPTMREIIPEYINKRMFSSRTDLHVLVQDIMSERDSLVSVVEKHALVRDLFCIMVNVDCLRTSISEYSWAPFVRSVHVDSLEKAVQESVTGNESSGEYIVLDMKRFSSDVKGLLLVVPTTAKAVQLDICSFAKLLRVDLPVAKHVYLAQPESSLLVSCSTVHTLITQSVQLSDPHRWVRVVEKYCIDCDDIKKQRTKEFIENPQVKAAQLLQRNWASHGVQESFYRFKPQFFGDDTAGQRIKSAVSEIMEFWRVGDSLTMKRLADQYRFMRFPLSRSSANFLEDSSEGFAVWDVDMKKWHCKHTSRQSDKYEFGFDGMKLVPWGDSPVSRDLCSGRYLLVSADSALMQDRKLYEAAMKVIPDLPSLSMHDYSIHLVSGVPGCGKTTKAIKSFVIGNNEDPVGDLILFPTKVASLDFRKRLTKHTKGAVTEEYLRMHVMTVDSFIINDRQYPKYKKLIIDEALMLHSGCIFVAAIKAKVKNIFLIGDVKQIPWVNRTSLPVQHQSIVAIVKPAEILSVSYRCTLSTAGVLARLYPEGMTAVSRITGEMSIVITANPLAIKLDSDIQYLTYTQADKLELQKRAPKGMEINTIHEFQGKENDTVCLVRGSTKKHEIYTREEHNLVAISRHKKRFIYVTPTSEGDVMCAWLSRVKYSSTDSLRSYQAFSGGHLPNDIMMSRYQTKGQHEYDDNILSCSVKWGIPNVSAAYPERVVVEEVIPSLKLLSNNAQTSVEKFQSYYDLLFPGNSCYDLRFLPELVAHSPLELYMENTRLNTAYRNGTKPKKFANLRPVMRTSMAVNRPVNQIETLLGMVKRNQAAPKLAGKIDWDQMADVLLTCFESTYIREDCRDVLAGYRADPIQCDPSAIEDWLTKQTASTLASIERDLPPHEAKLTSYQYMIKNKVKPQLDCGAPFTYSAVQTIAYQRKNINALFCPIFKYMRRRLTPIMKKKFKIFTDMSHEQFALEIERDVGAGVFNSDNFLEVDISKYDKSQSEVVLTFECNLMRRFGVPEYWVTLWWNAHCQTTLSDKNAQVSCSVEFQRKSGDASTFFGNTVFLMALLASLYDLNKVDFACFAGDDSIIIGGDELSVDYSYQCANIFNLEAKFMRNWKYMSFCSKFFIVVENKLFLVPDPVKLLTKLGRHDVVNWEHLEEYRVSMRDMTMQYSDGKVSVVLARAISDRYNCAVNFTSMIESLYALSGDFEVLKTFFYSEPYDVLCNDPTRPSFD